MISLPILAALAFAAARATQLVVWDSIASPLREKLDIWHAQNHTGYWRTFWRTLVNCLYCTGWHISWMTVAVYLTATQTWGSAPLLVHGIEAWGVAGGQMLINRWDDSLSDR